MADTKLINANIDENTGIAWLTLNRPEKKNALSIALLAELSEHCSAPLPKTTRFAASLPRGARRLLSSGRDLYE